MTAAIYLHPALTGDPLLVWAVQETMRMRAIVEGHRVRLVPRAEPEFAKVVNINSAIQAQEE